MNSAQTVRSSYRPLLPSTPDTVLSTLKSIEGSDFGPKTTVIIQSALLRLLYGRNCPGFIGLSAKLSPARSLSQPQLLQPYICSTLDSIRVVYRGTSIIQPAQDSRLSTMSAEMSAEQMQAKIATARRDAEGLKDKIKRKKDELADTSCRSRNFFMNKKNHHREGSADPPVGA